MVQVPSAQPINILFVCRENACRSQIAEAFARLHGTGRVASFSAGSQPRGSVDATAQAVMQERGIALDAHRSKGLQDLPAITWDVMIGMGCGDACPQVRAKQRIEWDIPDPAGAPLATYRAVRDLIEQQVKTLISQLPP